MVLEYFAVFNFVSIVRESFSQENTLPNGALRLDELLRESFISVTEDSRILRRQQFLKITHSITPISTERPATSGKLVDVRDVGDEVWLDETEADYGVKTPKREARIGHSTIPAR